MHGLRLCLPVPDLPDTMGEAPSEVSRFPRKRLVLTCRALRPRGECEGQAHFSGARIMAFRVIGARRLTQLSRSCGRMNLRGSMTRPVNSFLLRFDARVTPDAARNELPRVGLLLGWD